MKRRPDQVEYCRPSGLYHFGGRGREPRLPNTGLAPEDHTRNAQRADLRSCPGLFQLRQLVIAAYQWTLSRPGRWRALACYEVMRDRFLDPFDQCRGPLLHLKVVVYQHLNRSETT